jgi:hypothetical protein
MALARQRSPSLLSGLVLLVLLFRSIIPAGFMPGQSARSLVPLVICTGMGSATIYVSPDKIPAVPHPGKGMDNNACPFTSVFATGLLTLAPIIIRAIADGTAILLHPAEFLPSGAIFKSYFSQAPPTLPSHS